MSGAPHPATGPAQLLLVDDEANIRRMLSALLREEGFTVAEAANGNAALLMLDQADPDVVLLDLLMPPGPDGLETLARIRERGRRTPVIMMSGKAQLTDAVRAVKLGAFQFLEKPLTPEAAAAGLALRPVTDCTQLVFSLPSVSVLMTPFGWVLQVLGPGMGLVVHFLRVVPGRRPSRMFFSRSSRSLPPQGTSMEPKFPLEDVGSQDRVTSPTSSGHAWERADHWPSEARRTRIHQTSW